MLSKLKNLHVSNCVKYVAMMVYMWKVYTCMWKVCRGMSTYPNAHAEDKMLIFSIWFPRNWFNFGIILNDFWSSTIWAIRIQLSCTEFKNPQNPGIQPIHGLIGHNLTDHEFSVTIKNYVENLIITLIIGSSFVFSDAESALFLIFSLIKII